MLVKMEFKSSKTSKKPEPDSQEVAFDPTKEVIQPAVMKSEVPRENPGQVRNNKVQIPMDFPENDDEPFRD